MGDIFTYIRKYGDSTFYEKEFNNIDAVILAGIIYINFTNILESKMNLGEALHCFFRDVDKDKFFKEGLVQKDLYNLAKCIKDKIRYRDIMLDDFVYDVTDEKQFSAITYVLPNKIKVIAYEGTDGGLVGWYEDFMMVYKYPVLADIDASKYLKKHIGLFDKEVYVVGHSKGGHLAISAASELGFFKRRKLTKVYNFDGPGFREKEANSKKFKRIYPKVSYIVPNYSVVGMLMNHPENIRVIKATRVDLYAHSMFNWVVMKNDFVDEKLSSVSKKLDDSIDLWLKNINDADREKIVLDIFDFLNSNGIKCLDDLLKIKSLYSLYKKRAEIDDYTRDVMNNFFKFNIAYQFKKDGK